MIQHRCTQCSRMFRADNMVFICHRYGIRFICQQCLERESELAYIYQGDNYHHCVDCDSIIKFGDMMFRGKWGYRCYTCQYYYDKRKNMPNIKITAEVDGKQVLLETVSTETFEAIKALEKPKEIPVARVGHYKGEPDDRRLFLKITDSIRKCIADNNFNIIAISLTNGYVLNTWRGNDMGDHELYENVRPL